MVFLKSRIGSKNNLLSLAYLSTMKLNNVLILSKITRYEFERLRYKCENDEELKKKLAERGSNIDSLLLHHKTHHANLNSVLLNFRDKDIRTKLVIRQEYETENYNNYDAIFTCGGDGTFLLAANKIHSPNIPVIGINTDPINSEGYLCLPSKFTKDFGTALDRILKGDFKWLKRNRISVILSGKDISPTEPVKIHDQQLAYPEFRFYEHVKEYENHIRGFHSSQSNTPKSEITSKLCPIDHENNLNIQSSSLAHVTHTLEHVMDKRKLIDSPALEEHIYNKRANGLHDGFTPNDNSKYHHNGYDAINSQSFPLSKRDNLNATQSPIKSYTLPDLALNEIFIGESLSSRVSYYELSIDDQPSTKQRSSGLTICTGTGSSSWYFNINKIPPVSVTELLKITNDQTGSQIDVDNLDLMCKISDTFNNQLMFPPDQPRMAYTIRDPVINNVCKIDRPRGFAERIKVKSRCWDACIVLDGGYSFSFNDGAIADLTLDPQNALLTIAL